MPTDRFITQRKTAWQRLEDLLKLLDTASLGRLNKDEVRELGRIYRRTASDLARSAPGKLSEQPCDSRARPNLSRRRAGRQKNPPVLYT
jgi:hypothetical protein